jgi:hypothetical protein
MPPPMGCLPPRDLDIRGDNILMDLKEIGWRDVDWIDQALDRDQ